MDTSDVAIHITTHSSSREKKRSNLPSDKPEDPAKRPRHDDGSNTKPSRKAELEAAKIDIVNSAPTTSFRHLFSFAKSSASTFNPLQSKQPGAGFSFSGHLPSLGLSDDPRPTDPIALQEPNDNIQPVPVADMSSPPTDAMIVDDMGEADPADQYYDDSNELHEMQPPHDSYNEQSFQDTEKPKVIPDDIASRPHLIADIAKQFCRQERAEDVEESWFGPDGYREMMRLDFKQKQQRFSRRRQLGATATHS